MNVISRLIVRALFRLSGSLPCRLIPLPSGPYLERYYLGRCLGRHWYLHRFVRNDSERHLHDHPWQSAVAIVLTGYYREERAVQIRRRWLMGGDRIVSWWNRIPRTDVHRITQIRQETWTLFGHSPWKFEWGFYDTEPGRWPIKAVIQYRQFKPAPDDPDGDQWWLTAPPGRYADREPLRI